MKTLLIVEDEKMIRKGIKTMVQRSGVPVDNILECSNGEIALEILRMQEVDVMLTDIRMPRMDGIALVKAMQNLPHKPLTVAISGYDDFSYAVEMLRMGVREYILKPVEREKVKEVLEKLNAEVLKKKESAIFDRNLGYQQLKYIIMNETLPDYEKEFLLKQWNDTILGREYLMVLVNDGGEGQNEWEENPPFIHLDAVEKNELYITDADYLPVLLKDELAGRNVGISSLLCGVENLKKGYTQALAARKEAFYLGKPSVEYEEINKRKNTDIHLEKPALGQIVQLLGTDKYENAVRQLERIFKNASLGSYDPLEFEWGMQYMFDDILVTYASILKTDREEIRDYYEIYGYNSLEEFKTEVLGWLTNFCDTLNSRFDDYKNKQKVSQAVSYIRENYGKDLNMAVVSNHISMNYSLFSYVFKQYTGKNFVTFLKEIRIEEAKRLLEETDMKVIDISGHVGYENEKHFMKTFKAACGVSPTEYRKNIQFKGKA